jgi:hypothetical protein
MCRRISWRSCSCCFRNIFFSANRKFFRARNDQRTSHHDFVSEILFWEVLRECIICSFSAINRFNVSFERRIEIDILAIIVQHDVVVFFFESRRFALSFFLSWFIDAFSTKDRIRCANESNCCRINNTMRNFKNEALNVVFLLETFFIQFLEARSSLFATFSSRSFFEIFSMSRNNDLKNFFLFKILFTIATIFFFFKKFCAFLTIEISALISKLLFAKQLFFDFSSIVFRVSDELLSAFDRTNCRWLVDWKKYVFFFFSFLLVKVLLFSIKTHSLKFKFSLFLSSFAISFS